MREHRLRLLVVLALALSVRVLYLYSKAPDAPIASVDGWGYYRLALNLAQGNGFSLDAEAPYLPSSVRTPLYPLFLLAVRKLLGPAPRFRRRGRFRRRLLIKTGAQDVVRAAIGEVVEKLSAERSLPGIALA
ncbi:MAG: hypothetical protein ACK2UX_15370, partial [Anaerolineae bacterium]